MTTADHTPPANDQHAALGLSASPCWAPCDVTEGWWLVEEPGGDRLEIEVYNHPERGMCVWHEDYAGRGSLYFGNGHIPCGASGLMFISPLPNAPYQPHGGSNATPAKQPTK